MRKATLIVTFLALLTLALMPVVAQDGGSARIRVAHFSPDTPAVDVFINGEAATTDLAFPTVTDWVELPAGTYEVAVAPAGAGIDAAVIGPTNFDLAANAWITLAAVGSQGSGTLKLAVVVENYSNLGAGETRVTAFHGIEGLPPVDVVAGADTLVNLLAFPGTLGGNDGAYDVTVPAGVYDLRVIVTRALASEGAADQVLFDMPDTRLDPGVHYFVAAVGTPAEPQLVFVPFTMPGASTQSLVDLVAANTRLSTLMAAIEAAGLTEELATGGPYTVFAPNDAAFAAALGALGISPEVALANANLLTQVLLYHVVPGALSVDELVARGSVTTLEGSRLEFEAADFGALINGSVQIVRPDANATNGVLHTVNGVLLPPALAQLIAAAAPPAEEAAAEEEAPAEAEAPAEEQQVAVAPVPQGDTALDIIAGDSRLSLLLAAAQAAGVPETLARLGPVTILAPNDAAFNAALASMGLSVQDVIGQPDLLRQILFYHIVPGGYSAADLIAAGRLPTLEGNAVDFRVSSATPDFGAVINRFARILRPDRLAADGSYVHTIDFVLLPPAAAATLGVTQDPGNTIVEAAADNGSFNTLLAALAAAGLTDTFNDPLAGPFTVFAPTDEAFAAALATMGVSAADVLANTEMLTGILQYHVVDGRVLAEEVVTLESVTTLQGADIAIAVQDGNIVLNDSANVVQTNIPASNGVIHIIDTVLQPPAE